MQPGIRRYDSAARQSDWSEIYLNLNLILTAALAQRLTPVGFIASTSRLTVIADVATPCRLPGDQALDIRRGSLDKTRLASFFDLPNARLIRKSAHRGDRSATLYIVAVSKADQAEEIIRTKVANAGDQVEDLGRVAGFLVQAFNLAPGEFIRVDANYRPQEQLRSAESR